MEAKKTALVILPFDPCVGVSGRKSDAIRGIIDVHSRIDIEVCLFPLEPKALCFSREHSYLPFWFRLLSACSAVLPKRLWSKYYYRLIKRMGLLVCSRLEVDFMFACTMWPITSEVAHEFSKKTGLGFVIQEHRTDFARKFKYTESVPLSQLEALKKAAFVQALTSRHMDAIKTVIPDLKLEFLHLAMPTDFFIQDRRRIDSDDIIVFGAWTNWREIKRLDLLLDAFSAFVQEDGRAELRIAGPVVCKRDEQKIEELKPVVREKVFFKGPLGRSDLKKFIDQCDVCVIPSDHETFALAAAEALSRGVPVLTTACGGPESFIVEGINGCAVLSNNVSDLQSAMVSAVNWRNSLNSAKIIDDAREQFSIDAVSSRLLEQYHKHRIV